MLRDGWFHTGDIGELSADGFLRITDRKKDLLVTSGGKKVAPQPIEARLKQTPARRRGGRRRRSAPLPGRADRAGVRRARPSGSTSLGLPAGDRAALVGRADVLGLYREIVDALNRDLAQFEQVKQIALLPAEFTIAGGELTPTLKVRRRVVETRWQDTIERLYAPQRAARGRRSDGGDDGQTNEKRRVPDSHHRGGDRGVGGDAGGAGRVLSGPGPAR